MVADTQEQSSKVKREIKILNLGCGNSCLSEEMFDDGYVSIWNVDYSTVVIQ